MAAMPHPRDEAPPPLVPQPASRSNLDAFDDVPDDFELPPGSVKKGEKYRQVLLPVPFHLPRQPPHERRQSKKQSCIKMNCRRPARIYGVGTRPTWRRLLRHAWFALRAKKGAPAPIREIRADLRRHICMQLFLFIGQTQIGPTLFNIYGRASGMEEIQNKSTNERLDGVVWLAAPLMNYMKNPRVMAQGRVQMNFRGIPDWQIRVDI
ncbi:unnamed protein product [Prorocentrum cordatum]|uniref:Uncharacterized protein n=1 Tax=Prorocentrum cordatum TaxID=2364126 RepID=A0ABN9SBX1_9DINO|nr:unnamed protein product [Polarella glacialis]